MRFRRRLAKPKHAAVEPHPVHDRRQLARHGDGGTVVAAALGNAQSPRFQRRMCPLFGQQHVRRFEEGGADIGITNRGYVPVDVDAIARLDVSRRRPETRADRLRSAKPAGSSTPQLQARTVTCSTPGIAVTRRHGSSRSIVLMSGRSGRGP
ncbi:MAG TPA: hypothetical protein VKT26_01620, partial [Acetobacteraceae bacterium]|nr:hypothetical protein [Acetobacteraceae bacterium]